MMDCKSDRPAGVEVGLETAGQTGEGSWLMRHLRKDWRRN